VSERLRRGALAGGLAAELIHVLKIKPHYLDLAEITGFGEESLVTHKILLEFYTEGIFCQ
jgi:hypothetical protein